MEHYLFNYTRLTHPWREEKGNKCSSEPGVILCMNSVCHLPLCDICLSVKVRHLIWLLIHLSVLQHQNVLLSQQPGPNPFLSECRFHKIVYAQAPDMSFLPDVWTNTQVSVNVYMSMCVLYESKGESIFWDGIGDGQISYSPLLSVKKWPCCMPTCTRTHTHTHTHTLTLIHWSCFDSGFGTA